MLDFLTSPLVLAAGSLVIGAVSGSLVSLAVPLATKFLNSGLRKIPAPIRAIAFQQLDQRIADFVEQVPDRLDASKVYEITRAVLGDAADGSIEPKLLEKAALEMIDSFDLLQFAKSMTSRHKNQATSG
jgi:hypothetical protein